MFGRYKAVRQPQPENDKAQLGKSIFDKVMTHCLYKNTGLIQRMRMMQTLHKEIQFLILHPGIIRSSAELHGTERELEVNKNDSRNLWQIPYIKFNY